MLNRRHKAIPSQKSSRRKISLKSGKRPDCWKVELTQMIKFCLLQALWSCVLDALMKLLLSFSHNRVNLIWLLDDQTVCSIFIDMLRYGMLIVFSLMLSMQAIEAAPFLTLQFYIGKGCKYCRFVSTQVQSLMQENAWGEVIQYELIDCNQFVERCRDSLVEPLLVMWEGIGEQKTKKKLGETGGTISRLTIRQWVEQFFLLARPQVSIESRQDLKGNLHQVEVVRNPNQSIQRLKAILKQQRMKKQISFNILSRVTAGNASLFDHNFITNEHNQSSFLSNGKIEAFIFLIVVAVIGFFWAKNGSPQEKRDKPWMPVESIE